jgi:hypothetical protein
MPKAMKIAITVGACALFAVAPLLWMAAIVAGKFR